MKKEDFPRPNATQEEKEIFFRYLMNNGWPLLYYKSVDIYYDGLKTELNDEFLVIALKHWAQFHSGIGVRRYGAITIYWVWRITRRLRRITK